MVVLKLFIGAIPEGYNYVNDVEAYFISMRLRSDEYTTRVLHEIEHADFINESTIRDRTGMLLSYDRISTGVKCLLLLHYEPDLVINCSEMGANAFKYLFEGCAYFNSPTVDLPDEITVMYNGEIMDGYECNMMIG